MISSMHSWEAVIYTDGCHKDLVTMHFSYPFLSWYSRRRFFIFLSVRRRLRWTQLQVPCCLRSKKCSLPHMWRAGDQKQAVVRRTLPRDFYFFANIAKVVFDSKNMWCAAMKLRTRLNGEKHCARLCRQKPQLCRGQRNGPIDSSHVTSLMQVLNACYSNMMAFMTTSR